MAEAHGERFVQLYYETAKVIYDLAEKMNENGEDSFPIHGTSDFSFFLFWEVEDEMCFVMI